MTGRFVHVNGQRLALWEEIGFGAPILFVHATGFHARCWNQIIGRLGQRHSLAVDMRGHGMSSKPAPPYCWSSFGEDMAALARELRFSGVVGVGHSMGAHSLVYAAASEPRAFSQLLLVDPVILPREYYSTKVRGAHYARKRRNRWASEDEMWERFRDRTPFRDWDPAVLRDYCQWGLVRDGDDFVLACPPDVEGSIYENCSLPDADLYPRIERIQIPVTVLRSTRARVGSDGPAIDMAASPTAPDLAHLFRHGRDIAVNYSHFIPMEAPALVADLVREMN